MNKVLANIVQTVKYDPNLINAINLSGKSINFINKKWKVLKNIILSIITEKHSFRFYLF